MLTIQTSFGFPKVPLWRWLSAVGRGLAHQAAIERDVRACLDNFAARSDRELRESEIGPRHLPSRAPGAGSHRLAHFPAGSLSLFLPAVRTH